MQLTPLAILRDTTGKPQDNVFCSRKFSNFNVNFVLTASVVTSYTVPADIEVNNSVGGTSILAYFKYTPGKTVFVLPSDSPVLALPTGVPTETLAELNPEGRLVLPGQELQFLTPDADTYVSLEFYAIQKSGR